MSRSTGPLRRRDRAEPQLSGVEHDVLDAASLPRVGDVHLAVGGLDHRGVGVLALGPFENEGSRLADTVPADRDVQHLATAGERSAAYCVVVDEKLAAIREGDRVGARVRIG